jgi:hypothetical protein
MAKRLYTFDRRQVADYNRLRGDVARLMQGAAAEFVDVSRQEESHAVNYQLVKVTADERGEDGFYDGEIVLPINSSTATTEEIGLTCKITTTTLNQTLAKGKVYFAQFAHHLDSIDDGSVFLVPDAAPAVAPLPIEVTAKEEVDDVWLHSWKELEFTAAGVLPTEKAGGRTGDKSGAWPLIEIENHELEVGTKVFAWEVAVKPPEIVIEETQAGGDGENQAWTLYIKDAKGGTYTLFADDEPTDPIDWDGGATDIKAEIEAAAGVTLSSFTGAGTEASPYAFSVTSDTDPHTLTLGDVSELIGDGGMACSYQTGGGGSPFTWTDIKTASYEANAWEIVPVRPDVNNTATVTDATNATPIVITTDGPHYFVTGHTVTISGVNGNTAANGTWVITKLTATTFELDTSAGNGDFTSSPFALATCLAAPTITLPDWSTTPADTEIIINVLGVTPSNFKMVVLDSNGANVNGEDLGGGNLVDAVEPWSGHAFRFVRAPIEDVGWLCQGVRRT